MNDKFFNALVVVWCTTLTISIFCTVIFFPYSYLNVLRDIKVLLRYVAAFYVANDDFESNVEVKSIESNKNESASIRNSLNQLNNEIGMLKIKINSLVKQ